MASPLALELTDAAPRALGELDNKEAEIRRRSATLGVTIVAGSNNHGWGRTVAAWGAGKTREIRS